MISTLYSALPHNQIKEKLAEYMEYTFNREGSLYLGWYDKHAFFTSEQPKNIIRGQVRKCVVLSIIFWTIGL